VRRALITGVTGQDGSYLAELLLGKGYEVHGLIRRASTFNTSRIDHLYRDPHDKEARLYLHYGDLTDGARLVTLMREIDPDEVYNLGAQSHVRVSFDEPEHTGNATALGAMRLLEAVRMSGVECRYYQASSSEMFGSAPPPQDESTPFFTTPHFDGHRSVLLRACHIGELTRQELAELVQDAWLSRASRAVPIRRATCRSRIPRKRASSSSS